MWSHLHVKPKSEGKQKNSKKKIRLVVAKRGGCGGELDEEGQKVQTSHYKINKS